MRNHFSFDVNSIEVQHLITQDPTLGKAIVSGEYEGTQTSAAIYGIIRPEQGGRRVNWHTVWKHS